MIFWLVFIVALILGLFGLWRREWNDGVWTVVSLVCGAVVGLVLLGALIVGIQGESQKQDLRSMVVEYNAKGDQRDALVSLLEDQLDKYPNFAQEVMAAINVESIIAIYPELGSDVYMDKTKAIIAINSRLAEVRLNYYTLQADICSANSNAFVPTGPWSPDCDFSDWEQLELKSLTTKRG